MRKKTVLFFTINFVLMLGFLTSCGMEKDEIISGNLPKEESKTEILSFNSRESLEQAIQKGLDYDSFYRKLSISALNSEKRQTLRSADMTGESEVDISFEDLVPEVNLARLLNENGEIIVNDTIYKINVNGTFYAHKDFMAELRSAVNNYVSKQEVIGTDLYQIGENVYRFDTYKDADFSDYYAENDDIEETILRSTAEQKLNVQNLPLTNGLKYTIVGKFFQSKGVRKSNTVVFPKDKTKRLNCAVFEYNNVFRQSTGITAKIQRKTGWPIKYWTKVKQWDSHNLAIGYDNVVIKCDRPNSFPNFNEELKKMRQLGKQAYPLEKLRTSLPYPEWMKESIYVNISLPVLIDEEFQIPIKDLIAMAKPKIVEFGNMINAQNKPPYAWAEELTYEQIISRYTLGVPLYSKNAIYLVFPQAVMYNKQDEQEITKRFSEDFIKEFSIGFSTNPHKPAFDWTKIKVDYKGAPNAKFLSGNMFAAGYYQGDWVGYRLSTK